MTRDNFEKLAKTSWQLPLILLFFMGFSNSMVKSQLGTMVLSGVWLVFFVCGLVCGGVACFGVKSHGRKKILIPGLIGVFLNVSFPATIIAIAVPAYHAAITTSSRVIALTKLANELSVDAPRMLDEETRFDGVGVAGDGSLNFNYTLTQASKEEINLTKFTEMMTSYLLESYKNTPGQMELLRTQGIKINHIYNDKNGDRLTIIEIGGDLQQ